MPGFWRVSVVYGLVLILTVALLIVLSDISLRFGASAFYLGCLAASVLVPAFVAGISFGHHVGRVPMRSDAWRFAGWFASIQSVLLALLLWLAMQDFLVEESDGFVILGVVLFVCTACSLLISRYFFGFGARRGVRTQVPR